MTLPLRRSAAIASLALLIPAVTAWGSENANVPGGAPHTVKQHSRSELTTFPYDARGDFHHSFHHPFTPSDDGPIAHWTQHGSTVITSDDGRDVVRLVNGGQGLQGVLMSSMHTETNDFNGYFDVKITSHHGSAQAADGMGFFFTDRQVGKGSAMGIDELYRGLGIVIDTFSNSRSVKVPYVYAYVSNGAKAWNAKTDGKDVELTTGCKIPMDTHVRIYVQFIDSNLHVGISLNRDHRKWHTCFKYNNVPMPFNDGGFIAFAAETGHFYATHDVTEAGFVIGDVFVDNTETHSHDGSHGHEQAGQAASGQGRASSGTAASGAVAKAESHEVLEDHLDDHMRDLYHEVTGMMLNLGGNSGVFANAKAVRDSFDALASMTAHSFTEISRMTDETKDVERAVEHMKQTTIDLHAYTERFKNSLGSIHDSVRGLRASNNQLRAEHEETNTLILQHSGVMHTFLVDLMEARPHGFLSALVFILLQILIIAGFAVVVKMGPPGRKMGRMV